eukprot:9433590-Pyramimonas_sp.AAC.1
MALATFTWGSGTRQRGGRPIRTVRGELKPVTDMGHDRLFYAFMDDITMNHLVVSVAPPSQA